MEVRRETISRYNNSTTCHKDVMKITVPRLLRPLSAEQWDLSGVGWMRLGVKFGVLERVKMDTSRDQSNFDGRSGDESDCTFLFIQFKVFQALTPF